MENILSAIRFALRKNTIPVTRETPMTMYWVLLYTLNAEVGEYLAKCSGIKRRMDVFVPSTVKIVAKIRKELMIATMPTISAP